MTRLKFLAKIKSLRYLWNFSVVVDDLIGWASLDFHSASSSESFTNTESATKIWFRQTASVSPQDTRQSCSV
jgi:hypothetical protein